MKQLLLGFLIATVLFSCSSGELKDLDFIIIQEDYNTSKYWTKTEGLPNFNTEVHSDGCSGGMSAIYSELKFLHKKNGKTLEWRHCCELHDQAYYYGGSKKEKIRADENLASCVTKVVGNQFLGKMMQAAVEIGGGPYLPTPYRWGYGEDYR